LFAHSDTRTLFDEIVLIAPDGRVVATDPPQQSPVPVNLADRDFFRQALASGEAVTSAPLLARTSGRPVVRLAVPVKDGSGRSIAVLAAGIDLLKPKVLGHIADAHIGSTGYYAIATRGDHPVYVIHPDRRRVLQPAPPVLIVDPTEAWDTDVVTRKLVRGPGWELRAVLPAEEAFAPLHHARQRLLLQMLLLALASGVLAWFGSDALLRPLGRLLAAMRTLRASPGAAMKLDLHGSDEQGELAREFDALMRELHERQAESAAAVDASPLGLFRTDREGRMTYVNEAYLRMHGLAREDAATGWLTLLREDLRAKAWANWQRTVQSAEPLQVLQRVRRADATEAVLSVRTAPIIVDGRVVGHAGTLSDITERALAERAQRTLTVIFDATTDYVVQADRRGRITYMNPASRRHNGLAPDAPVGHLSYADLNPPEMLERYRREIVPTALAQGVWVGETIALDLSGQRTVCSHMLIAHRDKRGRLEHFSAIMRDISVEKAAAQALARNEQTLRSLADTMPAIVAVIDRQQRYRFVNASFERWYQVSRDTIAGRAVRDVIGEPEYRYSEPYIERVLAGEDAVYDKAFHERDSRRHLEVHYTPLRAADGSVDGYVVVAHDITARKEEEQRLRELTRVDPLTGLLNRNGFDEHLRECADRAQADEELLALLYIDLDHFK
ncbi:PAS domain-containing protein, partial [Piscinibacter sp.]|uniref:PAS domain-containing protein n=1 Tax=Piscinibacter sp. TaxID=1903157 RepID=UPI002F3F62D6